MQSQPPGLQPSHVDCTVVLPGAKAHLDIGESASRLDGPARRLLPTVHAAKRHLLWLDMKNHRVPCQAASRPTHPLGHTDGVRADARPNSREKSLRWRKMFEKCCKHGIAPLLTVYASTVGRSRNRSMTVNRPRRTRRQPSPYIASRGAGRRRDRRSTHERLPAAFVSRRPARSLSGRHAGPVR
jgi:hypothetical protein